MSCSGVFWALLEKYLQMQKHQASNSVYVDFFLLIILDSVRETYLFIKSRTGQSGKIYMSF